MTDPLRDIMAALDARAATAKQARKLPPEVKKKLADKREWSRIVGVCIGCNEELIRDRKDILRCPLITEGMNGPPSATCGDDHIPHELDPKRTYLIGRKVQHRRDVDDV